MKRDGTKWYVKDELDTEWEIRDTKIFKLSKRSSMFCVWPYHILQYEKMILNVGSLDIYRTSPTRR